jgi:formylglycine-generating enzyme required for sulfatase activity
MLASAVVVGLFSVVAIHAADTPSPESATKNSAVYVETKKGVLKIEAFDPEIEIHVAQNGRQVEIQDKKTGSKIAFDSGEFRVKPNEEPKDVKRDKDTIQLTRNGAVVATVTLSKIGLTKSGSPPEKSAYVENKIGMKLAAIPAGEFTMGAAAEEVERFQLPDWARTEGAPHKVKITKGFLIGAYPVTVGQFRKFIDDSGYKPATGGDGNDWQNPGTDQADDYPVVMISWNDADAFCKWLSKKEGKTYRLPSEAEWEYACRAGTKTAFSFGDDAKDLEKYGWFKENADGKRHPVGKLLPNKWGVYDMHGNVYQWTADWHGADYFKNSPESDPRGPSDGTDKVMRGGEYSYPAWACRSAARKARGANYLTPRTGFRVVCEQ